MTPKKLRGLIEVLKQYGVSYFCEENEKGKVVLEFRDASKDEPVEFDFEPDDKNTTMEMLKRAPNWSSG